jgi:hypothetical protein
MWTSIREALVAEGWGDHVSVRMQLSTVSWTVWLITVVSWTIVVPVMYSFLVQEAMSETKMSVARVVAVRLRHLMAV